LMIWVHGADDGSVPESIKVVVGYGQDKTGKRHTAEIETIDALIKGLNENNLTAIKAGITENRFCARDINNMNQYFRIIEGKKFDTLQSFQLEFRMTGCRDTDESLKSTARDFINSISALVQPDGKNLEPAEKKEQPAEKALAVPDGVKEAIDEGKSESIPSPELKQPAEADANVKANIESEPAEEIPAQETIPTEKMTDADDRGNVIDVGEAKALVPAGENAMVKVSAEVSVVEEDPKVEKAYQHLKKIFVKHISKAMLEAGQYLIQQFYDGDYEKAKKKSFTQNDTLKQLFDKLQTETSGNAPRKSWLYNSINLAIAEEDYKKVSIYGKLGHSHKLVLIGQEKIPEKTKIELMEKTVDEKWTVLRLQEEINKQKTTDGIKLDEPIPTERLIELDVKKLSSLKNLTTAREKKTQKDLTIYQDNLKKIEEVIKTKPKTQAPNIISVSRRTDIPACYSDWFFNRLKEGFVQVRKSMETKPKRVSLKPEDVRCFVFWTKNPGPMLGRLDELKDYHFYFHFTLTPYGQDIEGAVLPPKD